MTYDLCEYINVSPLRLSQYDLRNMTQILFLLRNMYQI